MSELEDFLQTVIPRQIEADLAMHKGDPGPRSEIYSHRDPVTLLGAFGVAATGWEEVRQAFEWVASRFTAAEDFALEVIAAEVSGDLAYTVGYERSRVTIDDGSMIDNFLRVTHIYRREEGGWKIVHRHGDALAADPAPRS